MIIAIENYEDSSIQDLNVTLHDARDLKETLVGRAGVDPGDILEMTDLSPSPLRPTKDNIMVQLASFVKKPERGDSLLFFYSGHGVEQNQSAYLVPIDAAITEPETLLKASVIGRLLGLCKAAVKTLVLDACHSGSGKGVSSAQGGVEGARRDPGAAPAVAEAGQSLGTQIRPRERPREYVVLESCKASQYSYEWPEKRESLYTYWLCRGLEGAADKDGDGCVSSDEVYEYTLQCVERTITRVRPARGKRQAVRSIRRWPATP